MVLEAFWLFAAILVPWALGSALIRLAITSRYDIPRSLLMGLGFPVGMYLAAGLLWLSLEAGFGLPVRSILILILMLTALIWWFQSNKMKPTTDQELSDEENQFWQIGILTLIACLTLGPVIADVWLRPLFPWDAWFSYGFKAKLIFSLQQLPDIVGYDQWFQASNALAHHTSSTHPLTVSLIQAWVATAIGRWSESLINLPWPALLLSMALVCHGLARLFTNSPWGAAFAFALVLTVPAYGIHTVLAGYLDLWLGAWLIILAAASCLWLRYGGREFLFLSTVAIAGCMYSKDGAIAYLLPLMFGFVLATLPHVWRPTAVAISALLLITGMVFFATNPQPTLYLPLGSDYRLGFVDGVLHVPFAKNYALSGPHPVWSELLNSLLLSRNFHLLGWLLLAGILAAIFKLHQSRSATLLVGFMLGTVAVFHFTLGYTRAGEILALGTIDLRLLIPITATGLSIALCFAGDLFTGQQQRKS